jgi:hypothetical protein
VPVSYLGGLTERIQAEQELTFGEQSSLLVDLRRALGDRDTRVDALTLASKFRRRRDLLAVVADDLDGILRGQGTGPFQPILATLDSSSERVGNHADLKTKKRNLGGSAGAAGMLGILGRPEDRKALLLQVFLGAGLFLANPRTPTKWIYPLAIILALWGFSLSPSGLDIDLGGRLDTTLDGAARLAFTIGGLVYLAGIVDLLRTFYLRKRA